jgi:DCN1-like protein 1/2
MKAVMFELRVKLGRDPDYFKNVYQHAFDFARSEGQRSLGESMLASQ